MEPSENGPEHDAAHEPSPTIYPLGFAVGIAVILVGLIIDPLLIASIGVVITLVFGFLWIRDAMHLHHEEQVAVEAEKRAAAKAVAEGRPAPVGERYPRSRFLESMTLGLGAVIGGVVTVPVAGFALLPAFLGQGRHKVDLGPLTEFPEGQWLIATFMVDPSLGEVSRRTAFVRHNGIFKNEPSFTIISNRCAHLGCPVQPLGLVQPDKTKTISTTGGEVVTTIPVLAVSGFSCPCHGGAYDTEGNRTAGPPVRGLDRYEFSIKNGHLILGRNYSVSKVDGAGAGARIHKYDLTGPGQHIDGWEQIFYPIQPPH